jgi:hypothetical protein
MLTLCAVGVDVRLHSGVDLVVREDDADLASTGFDVARLLHVDGGGGHESGEDRADDECDLHFDDLVELVVLV